ncbi:amidohydrolase [Microbulbifer agarilyticus]|uniref:amidohydrolase n=1 Tax=Microbulbifer agarilyticus TaxID=260552 RepID=UPI0021BBFDF8|nr:amidohydrolase [Microbulbifer agarilyticus]
MKRMLMNLFRLAATGSFLLLTKFALAQSVSLQSIAEAASPPEPATIFVAKEIVTLSPNKPNVTAVAVIGDRVVATGSLAELRAAAGDQKFTVDRTFADKVLVPGLIAQHDHPMLTALTMSSEIIAIETWQMPYGTIPAANNEQEYRARLKEANAKLKDPNEVLFSWGFHQLFHGELSKELLDKVSTTRPIVVIHRSWHETFMNTKALEKLGIDQAFIDALPEAAQKQTDLAKGHFWESGMFAWAPQLLSAITTPQKFHKGLQLTQQYMHTNGVTLASEPGGLYSKELQAAENAVLSPPDSPFRYYFIPDGRSIFEAFPDNAVAEVKKTLSWGEGMTSITPNQIKLFADGAVYSQLMQLREPYLDGHHGEWIMQPENFSKAFRTYWDADYQIHIHVNGDAGLDLVLDNLEENMRRKPRHDHRTVLVHIAVSDKDQIDKAKKLGAIFSGNPYYLVMLGDRYSKVGLGPQRADNMVRIGDIERAGISYSFHSDMPMAPAQPLFLMHSAVNRKTVSGRVAGPEQRASRMGALKAVTLDAAYSLRLEEKVGSIVPGKLANFTVLADNPVTIAPEKIKDIGIWGTVHEGRKLPIQHNNSNVNALGPVPNEASTRLLAEAIHAGHRHSSQHPAGHGDICMANRVFGEALGQMK